MGRRPHYDRDEVLLRAMQVFWTYGYDSTSIDRLVQATGLQRSGLYRAFGSKAGLFRESVEQYSKLRQGTVDLSVAPLVQLQQWFDFAIHGELLGVTVGRPRH